MSQSNMKLLQYFTEPLGSEPATAHLKAKPLCITALTQTVNQSARATLMRFAYRGTRRY